MHLIYFSDYNQVAFRGSFINPIGSPAQKTKEREEWSWSWITGVQVIIFGFTYKISVIWFFLFFNESVFVFYKTLQTKMDAVCLL